MSTKYTIKENGITTHHTTNGVAAAKKEGLAALKAGASLVSVWVGQNGAWVRTGEMTTWDWMVD